ncbi:MAG: maleylacetoacetate isomerase [Myxococcota bacterium]
MSGLEHVRLRGYWRSSSSWRVRIMLGLKGVPWEHVGVHLLRGEHTKDDHRALSPLEQVPVLEWVEDGETRTMTQSLAIASYLDARVPEPPLLPAEPLARARVWELAEMINSGIQPHQNSRTLQRVEAIGGDRVAWAHEAVAFGLGALEWRATRTAGRFLHGDVVSLADVCLVPQLFGARRFGVEMSALPTLERIEAACMEMEAFQEAVPEKQPDAF